MNAARDELRLETDSGARSMPFAIPAEGSGALTSSSALVPMAAPGLVGRSQPLIKGQPRQLVIRPKTVISCTTSSECVERTDDDNRNCCAFLQAPNSHACVGDTLKHFALSRR